MSKSLNVFIVPITNADAVPVDGTFFVAEHGGHDSPRNGAGPFWRIERECAAGLQQCLSLPYYGGSMSQPCRKKTENRYDNKQRRDPELHPAAFWRLAHAAILAGEQHRIEQLVIARDVPGAIPT